VSGGEAGLVERRVAHRLRAERVEPGREVPVHAVRLDERHRRRDARRGAPRSTRLGGRTGRIGAAEPSPGAGAAVGLCVRGLGATTGAGAPFASGLEDPAPLVGHARRAVEEVRSELATYAAFKPVDSVAAIADVL
jgi:hypothetical protein